MPAKPRHTSSKTWSKLRSEIEAVLKKLEIDPKSFIPLNLNQWQVVQEKIERKFFKNRPFGNGKDIPWNDIKCDDKILGNSNTFNAAVKTLEQHIDKEESIYFFINERVNEKMKYWFYESKIPVIIKVINELYNLKDIYLSSKKYDWLIHINEYNMVIIAGETNDKTAPNT